MRIRKYLVALAFWRRKTPMAKETGDPFYLVFTLGPRGGLRYIMAVPTEKIDNLWNRGLLDDYEINPRFKLDVHGPTITVGVLSREIDLIKVFRGDILEKALRL